MKKSVVFIGLLLLTSFSYAQFWSGNLLLSRLNGQGNDLLQAYGYITGVADATNTEGSHCIPSGVNVGQMADVVKQVLEAIPEHRHQAADTFVKFALKNAWPCKPPRSM
jgi:hypothetical protein